MLEVIAVNKFILALCIVWGPAAVLAQEASSGPAAKKQLNVNFGEDELIKGSNPSPEVEFIFEKANFNYKKLIRLRENFIPEADGGREGFGARE